MTAILFGSIGTLVETSEVQRAAFNAAFQRLGLDWTWERDAYREMLGRAGGADRVQRYAAERGDTVDPARVHALKTELFLAHLRDTPPPLRPGVAEVIGLASHHNMPLGFITTTERDIAETIAKIAEKETGRTFDLITWRTPDRPGKPDPAVYAHALDSLETDRSATVAIEDNKDGVAAGRAAGLVTLGFFGANTPEGNVAAADVIVREDLPAAVRQALPALHEV